MIQEKDFLYRVPVKTAPITTPGGQIRNPEILVDVEGGEFMHGNILDANSTNKLINQSVKEAVDNKLVESGYVTKDLLEAETTRATEQENSLKTLIGAETSARTKGDEDLSSKIKAEQTRAEGKEKEISDKLAIVNGDSNTEGSFRKAIADVVAAAPEVDTSDFVSKTATDAQSIESELSARGGLNVADRSADNYRTTIRGNRISIQGYGETSTLLSNSYLNFSNNKGTTPLALDGENGEITISNSALVISKRGIFIPGSDKNHVLTAGNSTVDITQYVLKSVYDEKIAALEARIAALEAKHQEATA